MGSMHAVPIFKKAKPITLAIGVTGEVVEEVEEEGGAVC